MDGYAGTILTVNLSDGRVKKDPLPEDLVRDWIGGEGIGAKLLWDRIKPGTDPLSPESALIFTTSAFTGTVFPPGSRLFLSFKSPLTGLYGQNAMGGSFAPQLKLAGYDVLIVEGKAEKPVYIFIDDDEVQIKDAGHLWGKLGEEVDELLREEIGDRRVEVIRIGPAGENLNRLACITSSINRALARGGNGAVMGSKNLKAIAARGTGRIPVHDKAGLGEVAARVYKSCRESPAGAALGKYDTHIVHGLYAVNQSIPSHHWQQGYWEKAEKLFHEPIAEQLFTGESSHCPGCPIKAGKVLSPKKGPYQGHKVSVMAGEVWAWGNNLMIDDLDVLSELWYQGAQNGVDLHSAAEWPLWLAECQERGILTPKDCGGLEVKFGDGQSVLRLLEAIFAREGFGDLLAEGPKIAAERIGKGSEEYVMHTKGAPLASQEFRANKSLLLTAAVEERAGFGHRNYTWPVVWLGNLMPEITGLTEKPDALEEKGIAKWLKPYREALPGISNTMGGCHLLWWFTFSSTDVVEGYKYLTGRDISIKDALKVGERTINLARAFNCREGFSRKDDTMPKRILTEPIHGGPQDGARVKDFEAMLDEYYTEAGFDIESGWPTRAKLEELELKDVVEELYVKGI